MNPPIDKAVGMVNRLFRNSPPNKSQIIAFWDLVLGLVVLGESVGAQAYIHLTAVAP